MVKISITNSDIELGHRFHSSDCPGALAIRRIVLPDTYVSVRYDGIVINNELAENPYYMNAPAILQQFVLDFDKDNIVRPFEFELDIPEDVLVK